MNQDLKAHSLISKRTIWRSCALSAVACLLLLAGCRDDEAIRIYTAPKEQTLASKGSAEPQQLLGALIAKESRPWAFKMVGAPEKVDQYKDEFRQLVDSLTFSDDGQPAWKLPDAWREEEGSQFTYRTFRPTQEPSVKATISELAYSFNPADLSPPKWQEYVLQNVNRWRGQLSLSDQAWDEMTSDLEPIEKLSLRDLPAYYVTLRGESGRSGAPMMGGPMSGAASGPAPSSPPSSSSAGDDNMPTKSQIQVALPEGWREVAPLSIMAWKSYEADGPENTKVQITLTPAGGDSQSNVVRWSGQIGGAQAEAMKAIENMERLDVNGKPAELYKIVGPEPNPKATTAAIVQWTSSQSLFVKMTGPAAAVSAQNEAFVVLLKSIKW